MQMHCGACHKFKFSKDVLQFPHYCTYMLQKLTVKKYCDYWKMTYTRHNIGGCGPEMD